ncbi:MAG: L-seryl-tRNA(Sec) selenium transferase [Gemmatimonadetes bacterium]|nr:L-seryl-tRNA(Sec) selenium transferase [Gemmatimonadota bacterium]
MTDHRRALPSVDRLLRTAAVAAVGADQPRTVLVGAIRRALADAREAPEAAPADDAGWAAAVARALAAATTPTLRRCINATGVVLHTNLGRAPLAEAAARAIAAAATGYSTLEYDVERGRRGSRHVHCADLLADLTGAEDAMVVNNAASALLLTLATAAEGGDVIVSRGELIEIGGGFRIPELMEKSGARLLEIGTTNRTRLSDYERALGGGVSRATAGAGSAGRPAEHGRPRDRIARTTAPPSPTAILKVHRSNFALIGFTEEASLEELVALGRKRKKPVLYDLGGGLMTDLADVGLAGEPTLPAAAQSGATAVIASGDKLLGGPQAGLLIGTAGFIRRCRAHPLARAARADKLTLAGLAATLALYRDPARARREIPVLQMLTARSADIAARARALAAALPAPANAAVTPTRAAVGGGAFPGLELESTGVALAPRSPSPAVLAERLRRRDTPVVAVVGGGKVTLDLRTVLPGEEAEVVRAVAAALG